MGEGRGEGTPWVWGTEEGQAKREAQAPPRTDGPGILSTPLEGLLPGGGTWSEKGCTPLFQTHLINLHTLEGRHACGPSSLLSGRGHPGVRGVGGEAVMFSPRMLSGRGHLGAGM